MREIAFFTDDDDFKELGRFWDESVTAAVNEDLKRNACRQEQPLNKNYKAELQMKANRGTRLVAGKCSEFTAA